MSVCNYEVAIHKASLVHSHFGATDHTANPVVSGIKMPVHMADADCSLFPLIIRLTVFARDDQVMAHYMSNLR